MGRNASHLHNAVQQFAVCDRSAAAIGGGFYSRAIPIQSGARRYRVRKRCAAGEFATLTQALAQWAADKLACQTLGVAIIEIADSATYHEAPAIRLGPYDELHLRAADMCRPVVRMCDYPCGEHERLVIDCAEGARFVLDGVLIAGAALALRGDCSGVPAQVLLRHCTLVPGWETQRTGALPWRAEPSLVVDAEGIALCIDHCIAGSLQLNGAGRALMVSDSIIDAGHAAGLAIADRQHDAARVCASIVRSTVIGVCQVVQLALAENAIFLGALLAGRRAHGLVRHCYLAPGSKTPQRDHCQPDEARFANASWQERQRLAPRYRSLSYGSAHYAKLAPDCAWEILGGADDGAEMGAYHDLHCAPLVLGGAALLPPAAKTAAQRRVPGGAAERGAAVPWAVSV